ncbi:MAG: FAD-dependent oxidoreductase [Thermofilaceae archaeon]
MKEERCDVVVVGGGPAGMAAAIKAAELGLEPVIVESRPVLGGVLTQCIHPGFGSLYFREELTGPEFAYRLTDKLDSLGVKRLLGAHVRLIESPSPDEKRVVAVTQEGLVEIRGRALIYAAGARERHQHEAGILCGSIAGVFTAGEAQVLMDVLGMLPGREVVIVGAGDVGMIMARRFALEGAKVKAVVGVQPYPGGHARNYVQCLRDFNVPLLLGYAVREIRGRDRVEKVVVAKVDENLRPIRGSELEISCDAVVLAVGLTPRVDLLERVGVPIDPATRGPVVDDYFGTLVPGIFAAGNALIVNDLVDYVVEQGEEAAGGAKVFLENGCLPAYKWIRVVKGRNVRLAVPHRVSGEKDAVFYLRVERPESNVVLEIPEIRFRMKLRHVKPAVMIRVKLSRWVLQRAKEAETLTLRVVPG